MKQPQLLPPLAEIHFCFLQKHPLNRSLARAAVFAKSFQVSLVSRISSLNSDETFITKHFPRSLRQSFGRKYSVLIETGPDIATECGVFAGIHNARIGGTTQTPCFVLSAITPLEANSSWSSG